MNAHDDIRIGTFVPAHARTEIEKPPSERRTDAADGLFGHASTLWQLVIHQTLAEVLLVFLVITEDMSMMPGPRVFRQTLFA
jgi:hypothetical protein